MDVVVRTNGTSRAVRKSLGMSVQPAVVGENGACIDEP